MKRLVIALVALALLSGTSQAAAPRAATPVIAAPAAATSPDPSTNPVLASIQKMGAKFYFLGTHSGMNGWFIVKDGQVQIAYTSPDNKVALIGAMFGERGENISATDVSSLVSTNKEVADLLSNVQKEQAAITQAGSPSALASAPQAPGVLPSAPLSPGERLMHDLTSASTVVVGNAAAPEILMVMDPRCIHCQATWKIIRETVIKGAVHIRMIPMGTSGTDNERAAAIFLGVSDPLNAWDKYVAGDKAQLDGTPSEVALAAVRANHVVTDNWKIMDTPYLVYRAKDGKVKVVQGEPGKISVVLADLGL